MSDVVREAVAQARFLLKFPDKCCAEVTRRKNVEPCDLPAVAAAVSTEAYDTDWWPVCRKHLRGRELVPLEDIVRAAQSERTTNDSRVL